MISTHKLINTINIHENRKTYVSNISYILHWCNILVSGFLQLLIFIYQPITFVVSPLPSHQTILLSSRQSIVNTMQYDVYDVVITILRVSFYTINQLSSLIRTSHKYMCFITPTIRRLSVFMLLFYRMGRYLIIII